MGLVSEQDRFLRDMIELMNFAHTLGFVVTGGELYRTIEQQRLHIQAGRSTTMNSQHLKRLAVDLNFFVKSPDGRLSLTYDKDRLQPIGDFWEELDTANRWGGNWQSFKDTPHFERREGRTDPNRSSAPAPTPDPEPATPASDEPPLPATGSGGSGSFNSASRRGMGFLKAGVGQGQNNSRTDVETVQRLLNSVSEAGHFALDAPLVPDGKFGRKTHSGIVACQGEFLGMAEPDGVISKDKKTIRMLAQSTEPGFTKLALSLIMLAAAEEQVELFYEPIKSIMGKYQITGPLRQAHFLAQIGHESGELRYQEELASGAAYEGRRDLGNTQVGDGRKFKGRGLIQLTGRFNYTAYSDSIDRRDEIMTNPGIIAEDLELCVGVAGWFWSKNSLNNFADSDDIMMLTRRINGGFNGINHRRQLLDRAKAVLEA